MKYLTPTRTFFLSLLLALAALPDRALAQPAGRGGLYGDWSVKVDYDGRQMESILAFSRDQDGNQTGQWISFWGANDLADVQNQDGRLSFSWNRTGMNGQTTTSKFAGTIADGALTGKLTSDRGTYEVTGTRSPRMPRAVGSWAMTVKVNDREFTSTLVLTSDADRNLSGEWLSEWGENKVTDVVNERGSLTFNRLTKMQDREWESTFEGTIQGDTLAGTIKSDRGDMEVTGTRIGAALIGTWNLEITSERGTRPQRMRVNSDLSGLYGALEIDKINLDGNKATFTTTLQFGDQEFEMSFAGTINESNLNGELTTSRGTQKITGTKVARRMRPRTTN